MKLVVDSNVLFTFFWKKSAARELFPNEQIELFSPEYALEEIKKYQDEIMQKAKLSSAEFHTCRLELVILIKFSPIDEYEEYIGNASKISPGPDDADFFALAIKRACPIWSNDTLLRNQTHVKILKTHEVIEVIMDIKGQNNRFRKP